MLHFMRCPLPSQCSLEGPLLLLIPDLVANPTWGGVSVYYGFLADLLEPEASSWFWVGVRLIWATPSQPGSLSWVGKPTWPFVCHRDAYYGKPILCHLGGWVGTQPSSSLCISNTRTDATVLWGIKYTCLTYFHPANMQVMQRCGLDEELISDLSKSLKD